MEEKEEGERGFLLSPIKATELTASGEFRKKQQRCIQKTTAPLHQSEPVSLSPIGTTKSGVLPDSAASAQKLSRERKPRSGTNTTPNLSLSPLQQTNRHRFDGMAQSVGRHHVSSQVVSDLASALTRFPTGDDRLRPLVSSATPPSEPRQRQSDHGAGATEATPFRASPKETSARWQESSGRPEETSNDLLTVLPDDAAALASGGGLEGDMVELQRALEAAGLPALGAVDTSQGGGGVPELRPAGSSHRPTAIEPRLPADPPGGRTSDHLRGLTVEEAVRAITAEELACLTRELLQDDAGGAVTPVETARDVASLPTSDQLLEEALSLMDGSHTNDTSRDSTAPEATALVGRDPDRTTRGGESLHSNLTLLHATEARSNRTESHSGKPAATKLPAAAWRLEPSIHVPSGETAGSDSGSKQPGFASATKASESRSKLLGETRTRSGASRSKPTARKPSKPLVRVAIEPDGRGRRPTSGKPRPSPSSHSNAPTIATRLSVSVVTSSKERTSLKKSGVGVAAVGMPMKPRGAVSSRQFSDTKERGGATRGIKGGGKGGVASSKERGGASWGIKGGGDGGVTSNKERGGAARGIKGVGEGGVASSKEKGGAARVIRGGGEGGVASSNTEREEERHGLRELASSVPSIESWMIEVRVTAILYNTYLRVLYSGLLSTSKQSLIFLR